VRAESDANILAWITGKAETDGGVTRTDIKNSCREVCKIELTRGWADSFILRHSAQLIEKESSPQEEPRVQVPHPFLDQTGRGMHDAVRGRPGDLVFDSISVKSGYPTARIDNRRGWLFRSPPRSNRFIIYYFRA
jgi:hypothetical protein